MEPEINNEVLIKNNIMSMKNVYEACKGTIKIEMENNRIGSGCFLKFERNGKDFYCIITNQHVIKPCMVSNKEEIIIKYDNESKDFIIKLDKKERIIEYFKDNEAFKIDAIIIEILEKDDINDSFFLIPNLDYIDQNDLLINKEIQILQFPGGEDLSLSMGKILRISTKNDFTFYHNADTKPGSSGSPIVLEGEKTVIAIHVGGRVDKKENVGIFIGIIVEEMNEYKKIGERVEYYKNGKIKYEGNFSDDEYNGDGKFYDENGIIYIGQFKNGKKNGNFVVIKGDKIIKEGEFQNDEFINKEDSDDEDNKEDNNSKKSEDEKNEDDSHKSHENSEHSDENHKEDIDKDNIQENKQDKKNEIINYNINNYYYYNDNTNNINNNINNNNTK